MAYIQAYSLLSDPEYINIVYTCLHANFLNKILFEPNVDPIWRELNYARSSSGSKLLFFSEMKSADDWKEI